MAVFIDLRPCLLTYKLLSCLSEVNLPYIVQDSKFNTYFILYLLQCSLSKIRLLALAKSNKIQAKTPPCIDCLTTLGLFSFILVPCPVSSVGPLVKLNENFQFTHGTLSQVQWKFPFHIHTIIGIPKSRTVACAIILNPLPFWGYVLY